MLERVTEGLIAGTLFVTSYTVFNRAISWNARRELNNTLEKNVKLLEAERAREQAAKANR